MDLRCLFGMILAERSNILHQYPNLSGMAHLKMPRFKKYYHGMGTSAIRILPS